MSAEDGVQIAITAEDEFSEAFNSAQESLSEFSSSVAEFSSTESDFTQTTNQVVESTQSLTEAQSQAAETTNELQQSTEESNSTFSDGMSSIVAATGAMAMGVTSVVGLGDAMTRQQEANLRLQNAQDNLTKSQNAYNLAVEKYGPNSVQAQNALLQLQNAQNNLTAAQDRAQMAGEQVNMQILNMATMTIPTLLAKGPEILAFLTGFGAEEDALTASQMAQSAASGIASGAMAVFDAVMDANPIVLVVLAIAGLVAALAYLTDGFKNFGPLEKDFNQAWKDLQTVFADVVGFIQSDVYPVLEQLYNTYVRPIIDAVNTITGIGSKISNGLSSIGSGLHIPGLAEGGIVAQPTLAMIGENGPEAVLPLSDYTITAPTGFQTLPQITTTTTNNTTSSPRTVSISIQQSNQISSNVDAENMAQDLATKIAQQLVQGY